MQPTKIAFADDHLLFRQALTHTINSLPGFKVTIEASNGKELIERLANTSKKDFPDLVLLDISMPVMSGIETTEYLRKAFPDLRILIVTMIDDKFSMLKLIKKGISGYIVKDANTEALHKALNEIATKGSYFTEDIKEKLIESLQTEESNEQQHTIIGIWNSLSESEKKYVILSCSEKTYAEITQEMSLPSPVTESYRQKIFSKFGVKTRVGLALLIAKNNLL